MIPGQNDTPADDIFNFDENEENVPPPFYISSVSMIKQYFETVQIVRLED